MAQLPNITNAIFDDRKITDYLLNAAHPQNHGKANFFGLFGFALANWQDLKKSLLDHPNSHPVASRTSFSYGDLFEISCSLRTPDGRNPCVRSFWVIEPPSLNPKFITAYAGP
jgi:hypothetical protein